MNNALKFWEAITAFKPHPLVRGGHMQTILGRVQGQRLPTLSPSTHQLTLEDGDQTTIFVDQSTTPKVGAPVAILLHGLGGCSESTYMRRMAFKLNQAGLHAVRINHRGANDAVNEHPANIYHSGSVADVLKMIQWTESLFPESPTILIGYSLSGTMILNLAGQKATELANKTKVCAMAAVSPPMDLEESSLALSSSKNWIYDRYYTKYLTREAAQRGWLDQLNISESQEKRMTLRRFDEWITAPLAGFRDRAHYYEQCSPNRTLDAIKVPTIIIQASNDPIVPPHSYDERSHHPFVMTRKEVCGGHLGFIGRERTKDGDFRWLDQQLVNWITEQFI